MSKLRHIALSVPDPWATAEFYMKAFDLKKVGEADTPLATGVYLSGRAARQGLRRPTPPGILGRRCRRQLRGGGGGGRKALRRRAEPRQYLL
jgi:catechol 2,3-dioxygenase-like lactoylglutathione lyase family enzyme